MRYTVKGRIGGRSLEVYRHHQHSGAAIGRSHRVLHDRCRKCADAASAVAAGEEAGCCLMS
ncbi:hypothetical protein [Numidum massiliense]|uniref:hypothetical protein n=1 Tax=Numidum massiliense TaxID=1522315 RepID=UPI0011CAE1C8|nr:hypothetical protein [Numidum massiliense]